MQHYRRVACAALAVSSATAGFLPSSAHAQKRNARAPVAKVASSEFPDTASLAELHYRYIGPEGNRTDAIAGVKGDPNVYYVGAASGGLWKTADAGAHWSPIFDGQPVSSIGAIAVAPSDPNVVWVGTGESFIRSHISIGFGMYRSTDAGKSWSHIGLENTGRIARIAVDPTDPDRALVAALGHAYGPQPERGIFRTTDGGKTWQRVLFVNDSTGGIDVILDPSNPRTVYAAMWQIEIHTWGRKSGGPGSSIWKSTDGGTTWTRLRNGLPGRPFGKVGLAISGAMPERIYAEVETGDGVPREGQQSDSGRLFRSDDAGKSWQLINHDLQPAGRTAYYDRMGVEPDNPNEAYFLAAAFTKTLDGGKTMIDPPREQVPRGDHHDIWFDPSNGNRFAVAHDGGLGITTTRGRTWNRIQLPIAQMYHVTVDNRVPYFVYGNKQDGESAMGPSNAKQGFFGTDVGIGRGEWRSVGGGESGWATPDTSDENLVWSSASGSGSVGGIVTRYDVRTRNIREVEVWPQATTGTPADSVKYRFQWTFPLTISPFDHNTLFVGSQFVHRTTDGGNSWQVISPDLTRNDKSKQKISGGLTPDNIGVEYGDVVFAIAESPLAKGEIWAGTNDGIVQLTRDGGKSWTNVTAGMPGMLTWGTVSSIQPSRFTDGTAYVTVDGHQENNRDPWVYRTTDFGKSWSLIVKGIPKSPLSYAHVIYEDPARKGLLYLGTENALYVSFDDGAQWQPLQNDLPHAPVYGIVVQPHFHDLVVATYGRGFYILDDLTPLEQWKPEVAGKNVALLKPRDQYRFRLIADPFTEMDDQVAGKNPPSGAALNFWIKPGTVDSAKKDSATFTVANAAGVLVRTMKAPVKAGLNRAFWDLRSTETIEAKIRSSPLYEDWFAVTDEGQKAPGIGRYAVLEPPGIYKVTIKYAGVEESQPLVILKDPMSGGSEQDLAAQMEMQRAVVTDINDVITQVNDLELVRGQLSDLLEIAGKDSARADIKGLTEPLMNKVIAVERQLFQMQVTGRGQDNVRWPVQITEQLMYLASSVGQSDYAPTASQKEVAQLLHARLMKVKVEVDQLLKQDVPAFNESIRGKSVHPIISSEN
ncbi:MAG: sialidase [Gemmatimonadaceae bacterium]|nr:sialidase [Gemmatimonadaceae bacterium]